MKSKKEKIRFIDPDKTRELQKDWQGYGKFSVWFGAVVFLIFMISAIYHLL